MGVLSGTPFLARRLPLLRVWGAWRRAGLCNGGRRLALHERCSMAGRQRRPSPGQPGNSRARRADRAPSPRRRGRDCASAMARSIAGTSAELYLRSRGIVAPVPPSIRFGRVPLWRDKKTGINGRPFPALITACKDVAGNVVGVQRIFLTEDGRKASMANPKLSLGRVRGCALGLEPPASTMRLCGGPEDGLTIRQRHPARRSGFRLVRAPCPSWSFPTRLGT